MSLGQALTVRRLWVLFACMAAFTLTFAAQGRDVEAQEPSGNAVISLTVAPNDPARVVAGTVNAPDPGGIYYSEDGGVSWSPSLGLPAEVSIAALGHDPVNPAVVYAGDAHAGLFLRSTDGGRTFETLPGIQSWLSVDSGIGTLHAAAAERGTVLYVGTRLDGVLVSYDRGESWVLNNIGLGQTEGFREAERRVRAVHAFNGSVYAGTHNGVFAQPPNSDVWARVPGMPEGAVVRSLGTYRGLMYAGLQAGGLWLLEEDGTWSAVTGMQRNTSVFSLGRAGEDGALFTAATGVGVYVGNGESWLRVQFNEAASDEWSWSVDGTQGHVYIGTNATGVLRSDDQGYSFRTPDELPVLEPSPLAPVNLEQAAATLTDDTAPEPTPQQEETVEATPTPVPETAETAPAEPAPDPTPTPAATPLPEPGTATLSFLDDFNLPLNLLQEDIELPVIGMVSPIVLAVAVLLVIIILIGSISVFRRVSDEED